MEEDKLFFISKNEKETRELGEKIAQFSEPGQLILLAGDLGVGKTVLAQGIGLGLDIEEDLNSPSYTLIKEYDGELPLFHLDLYRLEEEEDLLDIGFEDYLDQNGIMLIEWPDLAYNLIPFDFLYIQIKILDNQERKIMLEAEGEKGNKLLERLKKDVSNGN